MNQAPRFVIAALVVAVVGGAFLWWRKQETPQPPPPMPRAVAPTPPAPAPDASEPAIRHPIETEASPPAGLPPLAESDATISKALSELLGRKSVLFFLTLDGFANRFVATVDNLGGENAAVRLWPVLPTPGRFGTDAAPDGGVIGFKNADRYVPFVRFVETIDTRRAMALYVRLYPLFQQAYEDLGHAGKYFNDRVVEVIDHLLATPVVPEPIRVRGPETLHQFEDPAHESRSAGQKILLRVGHANAEKLKAKLIDIRRQLARK